MRVWCKMARSSHKVVTSDAAKLAAVMRAKFIRPVACGTCDCEIPLRHMATSDMKKVKSDTENQTWDHQFAEICIGTILRAHITGCDEGKN